MGIYDREYYRREGPSFLGSFAEQGHVCKWLLAINIVCFVLQVVTRVPAAPTFEQPYPHLAEPFTDALVLDVDRVMHGEVWRLLTYGFLHSTSSIWHILFNMLLLYWFGRQVEDRLGSREFLCFYLCAIVVSGLAYMSATLAQLHPNATALGASGGVMAVMVLAAIYNPRQIIYLFFLIPVPIWAVIAFMVANDAFHFLGQTSNGIAVSAHLGGAAFGLAYHQLGLRLTSLLPGWRGRKTSRVKPRLRLYREDEEASTQIAAGNRPAPAPRPEDAQLEAEMDAILAKIPRVGMEGLTEHERQLLLRASEAIKRRRG